MSKPMPGAGRQQGASSGIKCLPRNMRRSISLVTKNDFFIASLFFKKYIKTASCLYQIKPRYYWCVFYYRDSRHLKDTTARPLESFHGQELNGFRIDRMMSARPPGLPLDSLMALNGNASHENQTGAFWGRRSTVSGKLSITGTNFLLVETGYLHQHLFLFGKSGCMASKENLPDKRASI